MYDLEAIADAVEGNSRAGVEEQDSQRREVRNVVAGCGRRTRNGEVLVCTLGDRQQDTQLDPYQPENRHYEVRYVGIGHHDGYSQRVPIAMPEGVEAEGRSCSPTWRAIVSKRGQLRPPEDP